MCCSDTRRENERLLEVVSSMARTGNANAASTTKQQAECHELQQRVQVLTERLTRVEVRLLMARVGRDKQGYLLVGIVLLVE